MGVIPFERMGQLLQIDKVCDFCGERPDLTTYELSASRARKYEFKCSCFKRGCYPVSPWFDTIEAAAKWWIDNHTDMLKRICDRCGSDIEAIEFHRLNICTVESDGLHTDKHEKYDLCEPCYKAFLRWLDEEREE